MANLNEKLFSGEAESLMEGAQYRGIKLIGLENLAASGLELSDVQGLLDRLPAKTFEYVPLEEIRFVPFKFYSARRGGEVQFIREEDRLPGDEIIARKRGASHFLADDAGYQDGRKAIFIFNVQNWDGREDRQLDKDTALYTLAHEIGHSLFDALMKQARINVESQQKGESPPLSGRTLAVFAPLIERGWKNLPASTLPRFLNYRSVVQAELHRVDEEMTNVSEEEMLLEEDFTTAMESYLYWQDLGDHDPKRQFLMQTLFTAMSEKL